MNITHDEIKKLAKLSRLTVHDNELDQVCAHLTSVLTYAARVQVIARDIPESIEIFDPRLRSDVVRVSGAENLLSQKILQQAPRQQERLFIVPKIL